jgi:DNA-binding transcriptional LysR family regulator
MDIQKVDWALFRSFLAVVDSGSLLGASKRLGSHQPTLTRHIAELESQLGVILFERTGRGLTPTAAGRAIIDGARQMAAAVMCVEKSLVGVKNTTGGVVRIAASEVFSAYLLPDCIANLVKANPRIQVELVASNQISNLLRREADIAIRMVRPTQASLIGRKLGELPIGLFASRDYTARSSIPRSVPDLLRHTLIGLDSDHALVRGFHRAGLAVDRDSFALRTDNQVAYIRLIEAGAGIGAIPKAVARNIPDLVEILPMLRTATLPIWLVVHREIQDNPIIRFAFDHFATELPGSIG